MSNPRPHSLQFTPSLAVAVVVACAAPRNAVAQSGPPPIPEEAFAACEAKAAGDACSVKIFDRELKGTCIKEPSGARLVCLPDDLPPPPRQ